MPDTEAELVAKMRAEGDQMAAAAAELARTLVTFRSELADGGFSNDAADGLATAYALQIFTALAHASQRVDGSDNG